MVALERYKKLRCEQDAIRKQYDDLVTKARFISKLEFSGYSGDSEGWPAAETRVSWWMYRQCGVLENQMTLIDRDVESAHQDAMLENGGKLS